MVPEYRQIIGSGDAELPIFIRIVLNIYQPFLMVFILISLSLIILFQLKLKKSGGSYKLILALIAVNLIFSAILFAVTYAGTVLEIRLT